MSEPPVVHKTSARHKLTPEGNAILKKFFENESNNPSVEEKRRLLAQVLATGGNDHFNMPKLTRWYQYQRKKTKSNTYNELALLLQETPDPSEQLIAAWSRILDQPLKNLEMSIEKWRVEQASKTSERSETTPYSPRATVDALPIISLPTALPISASNPGSSSTPSHAFSDSVIHPLPILQLSNSNNLFYDYSQPWLQADERLGLDAQPLNYSTSTADRHHTESDSTEPLNQTAVTSTTSSPSLSSTTSSFILPPLWLTKPLNQTASAASPPVLSSAPALSLYHHLPPARANLLEEMPVVQTKARAASTADITMTRSEFLVRLASFESKVMDFVQNLGQEE